MAFSKALKGIAFSLVAVVVLTLSPCVPTSLYAQVSGATLSGTVTDSSGAAIPEAQVSIKNTATGVVRDVPTTSAGFYTAPNLLPGTYNVTFSLTGFATVVVSNLVLEVGSERALNQTMKIGQTTQTVVVTAEAPTVQLTSSALSAEVTSTTVRELPLNGRDWTQLATLQPGVLSIRAQASTGGISSRANRGFGNQLTDSGHRPYENNYRVNGVSINDYTNGSPGSVQGANLGVDAIQEFSVLTSNYEAEYGRTSGAVINAITRSGTNQFHGSAYEFLRNSALDARNFFDAPQIPPFRRNQFGASGGGPIMKDKTFIFGDYEGIRQSKSLSFHDKVPTAAARAGNLCSVPTTGTCTPHKITGAFNPDPTTGIDQAVLPFLGFWPLPLANATIVDKSGGDVAFVDTAGAAILPENYATVRVDHAMSEKDNFAASWFYDKSNITQPDSLRISTSASISERYLGTLEENHIFSPTLTNAARFGFSRTTGVVGQGETALNPLASDLSLGAIPGRTAPTLTIPSLTSMLGSLNSVAFTHHVLNSFQGYDDAFLTRGTHSLKFGFAVEHLQDNVIHFGSPTGTYKFPSFLGFLQNHPTNLLTLIPGSAKEVGIRQTLFGVYVQDDWHARKNLTLNFGLRYEPTTLPSEAHGQFGVLETLLSSTVTVPIPSLWKTNQTLKNFEPRVGISWDPFGDGKTAVRSGFGIFDVLPLPWQYSFTTSASFPFVERGTAGNLAPGTFPTLAVKSIGVDPTKLQVQNYEQNPHRNYAMNWNLNIQRQISPSLTATIGYVGSHTVHQNFITSDANMALPTVTSAGDLWPFPVGSQPRLNTNVGAINSEVWDNSSSYEGFQAQVIKRMSHGFQVQGSYTWGKCFDSGSSGPIADPFTTSLTSLIGFDPQARRGLCDFDIRHGIAVNAVWQIPTPKVGGAIVGHLLGGWELGGVFTGASGSPTTLVIGGDPLGQNSTDTYNFPDRLTGPGCTGNPVNPGNVNNYVKLNCFTPPVAPASFAAVCQPAAASVAAQIPNTCMNLFGNAGRNSIIGPGLLDFDFSLFKNIPVRRISEVFNIQFRAEFFNAFNRPNFQVPNFSDGNNVIFNQDGTAASGAGAIDATSTDSRQIQFGLKFVW